MLYFFVIITAKWLFFINTFLQNPNPAQYIIHSLSKIASNDTKIVGENGKYKSKSDCFVVNDGVCVGAGELFHPLYEGMSWEHSSLHHRVYRRVHQIDCFQRRIAAVLCC